MTIAEQLHKSATHKPGQDPNCPVCNRKKRYSVVVESGRGQLTMNTEKITVYANPKCEYCLGKGVSLRLSGDEHVCPCVTEQLRIIVVAEPNYSIPRNEMYTPGKPEFIWGAEETA